jgi:hypothetical protein
MTYDELITTVSAIINNPEIYKVGLTLTYELPEKTHRQMNENFFYAINAVNMVPQQSDMFEVEVEGVIIRFIKRENS